MIKPTKRKAFNFLRSYFDVLNTLEKDTDKLEFLISVINKQFLNEDPKDLGFISNLCYESQRHQIESSVKGWERASKEALSTTLPTTPSSTPPTNPKEEEGEVQEEEEEEVKEKQKDFSDKNILLLKSNTNWKNLLLKTYKIDLTEFERQVDRFSLVSDMNRDIEKIKSHFGNWIAGQDLNLNSKIVPNTYPVN